MAAVDSLVPLGASAARHEKAIRAQRLEPKDLSFNIKRDRHPALAPLWRKIFFWPIDDPNPPVDDPMCSRVQNLDVAQPESRKQKVGHVCAGVFPGELRDRRFHRFQRRHVQ